MGAVKLAFHGADTDTGTDTDSPNTATVLRPTHAVGEDIGVGVVECQLYAGILCCRVCCFTRRVFTHTQDRRAV